MAIISYNLYYHYIFVHIIGYTKQIMDLLYSKPLLKKK